MKPADGPDHGIRSGNEGAAIELLDARDLVKSHGLKIAIAKFGKLSTLVAEISVHRDLLQNAWPFP